MHGKTRTCIAAPLCTNRTGDPAVGVVLSVPDGAPGVDGHWVTYLRNELHKAGVRHLAIGGAE